MTRLAIFVLFYGAIFGYPWIRLAYALQPNMALQTGSLLALFCLPAAIWIASRKCAAPYRYWLARLTYCWLGVSWLALSLSLIAEPLHWLTPTLAELTGRNIDAATQTIGLGVLLALAGLTAIAIWNANTFKLRHLKITHARIRRPMRIVQLSDVHIGSRSAGFLQRVVANARAAAPDLVVITGDLVDGMGVAQKDLAVLGTFACPVYFAIGNHERYVDCDKICARLQNLGIHVLRDEVGKVTLNAGYLDGQTLSSETNAAAASSTVGATCVASNKLHLAGIDDAEAPTQVATVLPLLPAPEDDEFSILLYHRPDGLEDAAKHNINLMLCGHTHNGQLVPFNFLVKKRFPRIAGRYVHDDTTLYVSVGSGTWGPPMRLGSTNEITCIELHPLELPPRTTA